jgi:hypothetical protein
VRCREQKLFEGELVELVSGHEAVLGSCPTCGTSLTVILDAP